MDIGKPEGAHIFQIFFCSVSGNLKLSGTNQGLIRSNKFAVRAFGKNEAFVFKFGEGFRNCIRVSLHRDGKITDGWDSLTRTKLAGHNLTSNKIGDLKINGNIVIELHSSIIVLVN